MKKFQINDYIKVIQCSPNEFSIRKFVRILVLSGIENRKKSGRPRNFNIDVLTFSGINQTSIEFLTYFK